MGSLAFSSTTGMPLNFSMLLDAYSMSSLYTCDRIVIEAHQYDVGQLLGSVAFAGVIRHVKLLECGVHLQGECLLQGL